MDREKKIRYTRGTLGVLFWVVKKGLVVLLLLYLYILFLPIEWP